MEAIQQLLQSTGLSPDELIKKVAEFKAISEKTLCNNVINENITDGGRRNECTNVTSTSDSVLHSELENTNNVDNESVVMGDGVCVSTTDLLCNNEVLEDKEEWVGDVEDDRPRPNPECYKNTDNPQLAITEELELVLSDKSKCIIEAVNSDNPSNHQETTVTDDTNCKNVSIVDNINHTVKTVKLGTTLNNTLNPMELNTETSSDIKINSDDNNFISDANIDERNNVDNLREKQQTNNKTLIADTIVKEDLNLQNKCVNDDKTTETSMSSRISTYSGKTDDFEDSFTEELQLTDFDDKVSDGSNYREVIEEGLHSSMDKICWKNDEDEIIVIEDDESQKSSVDDINEHSSIETSGLKNVKILKIEQLYNQPESGDNSLIIDGEICSSEKTLITDDDSCSSNKRTYNPYVTKEITSLTPVKNGNNEQSSTESLSQHSKNIHDDIKSSSSKVFSCEKLSKFVFEEMKEVKQDEKDELLEILKFPKSMNKKVDLNSSNSEEISEEEEVHKGTIVDNLNGSKIFEENMELNKLEKSEQIEHNKNQNCIVNTDDLNAEMKISNENEVTSTDDDVTDHKNKYINKTSNKFCLQKDKKNIKSTNENTIISLESSSKAVTISNCNGDFIKQTTLLPKSEDEKIVLENKDLTENGENLNRLTQNNDKDLGAIEKTNDIDKMNSRTVTSESKESTISKDESDIKGDEINSLNIEHSKTKIVDDPKIVNNLQDDTEETNQSLDEHDVRQRTDKDNLGESSEANIYDGSTHDQHRSTNFNGNTNKYEVNTKEDLDGKVNQFDGVRNVDDINQKINKDIDENDLNKTIKKNIDLMKEIVNRICKSQTNNENESQETSENTPSTSLDDQEKSDIVDGINLTMIDDEEPFGILDDSDYMEDFNTEDFDSGEGPSVSGIPVQHQDTMLTYETNSPTTHKPLIGCIRKHTETTTENNCTDDNNDILETPEKHIEEPSSMREKLFSQLFKLRQRKVNESPLINIVHPIPNTYSKRINLKTVEPESDVSPLLGIKIVDVRGGVEIDKIYNNGLSPIKLTKTQDITKIKGWRKKKLLLDNSVHVINPISKNENSNESLGEGCSYNLKDDKKSDEGLNVFASNNLEGFLRKQKSLNISYDVPNLESSNHKIDYLDSTVLVHEPLEKCTDKKRQYVLAETEESNTLKQNIKSDITKPRTLAEKRKLLNKTEENDEKICSSIYCNGARYIIPTKYKKPIYIGGHRKNKKKYKFVPVDERRRQKPSILNKETLENKPKVSYRPGPLCKKQYLQQSCQDDWESVLVKLPKITVEIKPEFTKPVHPIAGQFVKFESYEISEHRADFALSALIGNKNEKKFSFKADYERDQEDILMRKKRVIKQEIKIEPGETEIDIVPENVNRVLATIMDDLIRCVENSEIENEIIKEDPDFTPYIEDVVIPTKYKENKVKRQIIKGSARRTNLELKRLNVKVIEVNIEDDQQPTIDCKKAFCKLGCVCNSLDKTTLPSDHCGNYQCIFKCKCSKRNETLKFVLPSGTDLLSECTVNKLQNEAKKDLAKVEKEFTQTVIHANNNTIVFGDSNERKRRSLKQPKKYEDYIETSIFNEDIIEEIIATPSPAKKANLPKMRPCFVKLEKLNLDHVIPFCWNHNVYECDCGYKMSKTDLENAKQIQLERRLKENVDCNTIKKAHNIESRLNEDVVCKPKNVIKNSNLKKHKKKSQPTAEQLEEAELTNIALEESISNQRLLWKHKEVLHCARTMGISTSYYLERNRMFKFKRMVVKKLGLCNDDFKDDAVWMKWTTGNEFSSEVESIQDRLFAPTKPEEHIKINNRRKQHLVTREDVYINEQNKKKIEEDIFHNYPEVYKPSDLVIEKFNELLGAGKKDENDYRLLQWSTMLQRYEAEIWEIWTAPSETKVRFVITNSKTTEVPGFINIRSFELMENLSSIKIDFIRWIMLRSSPGDKSPENTLLILKKANHLWEVCGMCAKNMKNRGMRMIESFFGRKENIGFSCNFYLQKQLIPITESGECKEDHKIIASLPNTPDNTKWKILKINSTFSVMEFKRNGIKVKCSTLINLIKQAQKGLNTLVINTISQGYNHKLFGIYITSNHLDKVFIGPYYDNESHDFETFRFFNNNLVTTEEYGNLTGHKVNPLEDDLWYKQSQGYETFSLENSKQVIDLTDKEEIIIHVVDDNTENLEENKQIYDIIQNRTDVQMELIDKATNSEKVDPLIIKISKNKNDVYESVSLPHQRKKRKSTEISQKNMRKRKRYCSVDSDEFKQNKIDNNDESKQKKIKIDDIYSGNANSSVDNSDENNQTIQIDEIMDGSGDLINKQMKRKIEEENLEKYFKLKTNSEEKDEAKLIISNTTPKIDQINNCIVNTEKDLHLKTNPVETNEAQLILKTSPQIDKMKPCIVNTSPRSLLKSSTSKEVSCKKTVASVEIRYFQMLKRMMLAAGIVMQSLTYPIAFKVNFSNELIHGYRVIDKNQLAIYMPGCTEPHFFHSHLMAAFFLQRTLEKNLIKIPVSYEIKVDLVEYPEYLDKLTTPVRSMDSTYFNEIYMVGDFRPTLVNDFEKALSQTQLHKSKKISIKHNDDYLHYDNTMREFAEWCNKIQDMKQDVRWVLGTMGKDNFILAVNNLNYILDRLSKINSYQYNRYSSAKLKLSARNLMTKIRIKYAKPQTKPKNVSDNEVICLDSDEEEQTSTDPPTLEPEEAKPKLDSINSFRPELTITPISELESSVNSHSYITDMSDTTIEPVNNKIDTFHSIANISKEKIPNNRLSFSIQNGKVIAKPKTVKLLMAIGKKTVVEKIDLSNFSTSTVSSMLGANLNSKQVMLTKEQLNSLKALSVKSKMNRIFNDGSTDGSKGQNVDESAISS